MKTARLELRISPEDKKILQKAASKAKKTLATFLIESGLKAASQR